MFQGRKWIVVLTACLLVFMSACSGGADNNNKNNNSTADPAANPAESSAPPTEPETFDPFGKYPETVEFTTVKATVNNPQFPEGQSYEDNDFNRFMQEQLNVKPVFQWTQPQDGFAYKQKLDLAIAGNDIPDVFQIMGSSVQDVQATLKRLVDADMVEDLTTVFEQYASPAMKENYASENNRTLDLFKIDGKIYGIPDQQGLENFNFVWIREDWRKQLGLPEPKTMDDVIAIAKSFKEKDPYGGGKTVPIAMQMESETNGLFGPGFVFDQYEAFPRMFYKDASGELKYGGIEPQTKEALKVLSQLYKDGLLERDFAMKDTGQLQEVLASGRAGIVGQAWWAVWYPLFMTLQNVPDADWKPYVITGENGKINFGATAPTRSMVVVKKGFKYPELPIKWLNVYHENKSSEHFMKIEQEVFKDSNDKRPIWLGMNIDRTDHILLQANDIVKAVNGEIDPSTLPFNNRDAYNHITAFLGGLQDEPQAASKHMLQWQNTRSWYDAMGGASNYELNITYSAYDGRTPAMEKYLTALDTLQMKAYHTIIMKSNDIDAEFDKFVSDWKAQGGDEILAEIAQEINK